MALFTVTNLEGVEVVGQFRASTSTADACSSGALVIDRTLYHDGAGVYPALGDTVYTDPGHITPLDAQNGNNVYVGLFDPEDDWLKTNGSGVRITISCP